MRASRRIPLAAAAALATSMFLSACIVVPADGYGAYGGYGGYGGSAGYGGYGGAPVMVAPPPPQAEVIGVAPGPGYFWINGYWGWTGNRHAWVGGRWEGQRPGYRWQPHRWQPYGQGWRAEPGHWNRG